MRVTTRLHTCVTIEGRTDFQTHADLDTCAEVDCVSFAFVEATGLQRSHVEAPGIHAVGQMACPTYGVYEVPFRISDSRGTTRSCRRPCVAIDRDPRPEGSPLLLSRTFLNDYRITLEPASDSWFFSFAIEESELLDAPAFLEQTRGSACVYAVTAFPYPSLPEIGRAHV